MIRNKSQKEYIIDLTGPDGNAFALMGHAKNLAKQLGMNGDTIIKEMTKGDYQHLVNTFDSHFGHLVILER